MICLAHNTVFYPEAYETCPDCDECSPPNNETEYEEEEI